MGVSEIPEYLKNDFRLLRVQNPPRFIGIILRVLVRMRYFISQYFPNFLSRINFMVLRCSLAIFFQELGELFLNYQQC